LTLYGTEKKLSNNEIKDQSLKLIIEAVGFLEEFKFIKIESQNKKK